MFDYLSSPIRWCESKFVYSDYIVEFWNSFSSFAFTIVGFYGYHIHKNLEIDNMPWLLLASIGLTSFIFHSTLSFFGQFIDEFSIVLLMTYSIKKIYKLNFILFSFLLTIFSSISWYVPSYSPFIFMILLTPVTLFTKNLISDNISENVWKLGIKFGFFSIVLWYFDFLCFFNTHCFWHIFCSIGSYYFMLLVVKEEKTVIKNSFIPRLTLYKKKKI